MAEKTEAWVLAKYPDGPVTDACFARKSVPLPSPGAGQVLLKVLLISVDPYLRIKMYAPKPGEPEGEGEFAPFKVDQPLGSFILGEVVESKAEGLRPGDCVTTVGAWQRMVVADAAACNKVERDLPLSSYLNVTGLIGLSTYFPVVEIGQPKDGDVVFVSGAAGAVGSLACQLFKAFGCRVIGCTSSDNKVEALRGLGVEAFNYRSTSVDEALAQLAPDGLDIYWDNVGGPVLDAVLPRMKMHGRIVACGGISQYHKLGSEEAHGVKNTMSVVTHCIHWEGFLAFNYASREKECYSKLASLVKQGKVRPLETVVDGFDKVPQAFMGLFAGENLGKMLIKIAEPSTPDEALGGQGVGAGQEAGTQAEQRAKTLTQQVAHTREMLALSQGPAREVLQGLLSKQEAELRRATAPPQKAAPPSQPSKHVASSAVRSASPAVGGPKPYTSIGSFSWDQGEYNSPWVYVYVSLDGVGEVKDRVSCDFTQNAFDLKVHGLPGGDLRLLKENLDKDIVPGESTFIVKKNRVTIKLKKVKGEFSYDHWSDLTAKRKKSDQAKTDPMGGIMDLMKDMYNEGDDNIKKAIGEAMLKAQRGEKSAPSPGFGGGFGDEAL